jgi:type II secretory pathway component GspD/PulD (secretin)
MKKLKKLLALYVPPRQVNCAGCFAADQTLRLNFCNVPLKTVLDYIGNAAGFLVEVKSNVAVNDKVDIRSKQPLSHDEALDLLERVLHKRGCTLVQNGRRLSIMRTEDAKKTYIPIRLAGNYQGILKGPASSRGLFAPVASSWSN